MIAAGELATYDHAKTTLKTFSARHGRPLEEGLGLHATASFITGFVAATVAAPCDIVKTRTMNAATTTTSPMRVFLLILHTEGVAALFRGWLPSYLRLGPHALIAFPVFERLRKELGLDYL